MIQFKGKKDTWLNAACQVILCGPQELKKLFIVLYKSSCCFRALELLIMPLVKMSLKLLIYAFMVFFSFLVYESTKYRDKIALQAVISVCQCCFVLTSLYSNRLGYSVQGLEMCLNHNTLHSLGYNLS